MKCHVDRSRGIVILIPEVLTKIKTTRDTVLHVQLCSEFTVGGNPWNQQRPLRLTKKSTRRKRNWSDSSGNSPDKGQGLTVCMTTCKKKKAKSDGIIVVTRGVHCNRMIFLLHQNKKGWESGQKTNVTSGIWCTDYPVKLSRLWCTWLQRQTGEAFTSMIHVTDVEDWIHRETNISTCIWHPR